MGDAEHQPKDEDAGPRQEQTYSVLMRTEVGYWVNDREFVTVSDVGQRRERI